MWITIKGRDNKSSLFINIYSSMFNNESKKEAGVFTKSPVASSFI